MSTWKSWAWIIGLIVFCFGVAYWALGMDLTKQEVEQQRKAIIKIGEQVNFHITKDRYQKCYNRNIPPEECPPEPEPLPPPRERPR
jgi:hypothetical protein